MWSSQRPDLVFADEFESGGASAWSAAVTNGGRLTVTSAAALRGVYGLQAVIADRNDMYVVDATPAALTSYRAGFRFDPNGSNIPSNMKHVVLDRLAAAGTSTVVVEIGGAPGG